jgi:tetratricopeptide (TPR) repeat protein
VTSAEPPSFAHPLAVVRHSYGWSYQGLVDAIARQAAKMPRIGNMAARREKAWRWEHWGVVPDRATQLALAAVLQVPEERLDRAGWPKWLPAGDAVRADFPWTADGCRIALAEALERAMLDRRGFLVLSGGVLTGLADQWLSVSPEKVDAALKGRSRLDADVVGWIEDRIPMLRRMDDQLGGTQLRQVVDAELRLVNGLLADGSYDSVVGSRLYAAAADLGQLAGWVSFDAGLHSAAQRYYVAALHAAQAAGNPALGANVLAAMSYQSITVGETSDAIALSERAVEGAQRGGSPRVAAMLAARQARAYSLAGDRTSCSRALGRAEEAMTHAKDGIEEPGWIYYFDEAELAAQAGACRLALGQYNDAKLELDHALQIQQPTYTRDRTIYHLRLATTQLCLGEVEHACSLGRDACDLADGGGGSQRIAEEMRKFRSRLQQYSADPLVKEMDERLEVYAA